MMRLVRVILYWIILHQTYCPRRGPTLNSLNRPSITRALDWVTKEGAKNEIQIIPKEWQCYWLRSLIGEALTLDMTINSNLFGCRVSVSINEMWNIRLKSTSIVVKCSMNSGDNMLALITDNDGAFVTIMRIQNVIEVSCNSQTESWKCRNFTTDGYSTWNILYNYKIFFWSCISLFYQY